MKELTISDTLRQPSTIAVLPSRFANEDRVVLRAAAENLNDDRFTSRPTKGSSLSVLRGLRQITRNSANKEDSR